MKRLLPLMLCLYLPGVVFGQSFAFANNAVNVFYLGSPNPVSIAVEHCDCSNLIVETDNGTIIKTAPCKYNADLAKIGMANIIVKKKQGNKIITIGSKQFRVKETALPTASIGGKAGGEIKKSVLIVQQGIVARMEGFDFETAFKVTRFKITIVRNSVMIFNKDITGNRFANDIHSAFQTLTAGDLVLFNDIHCIGPDKRIRSLLPIEFTIIP